MLIAGVLGTYLALQLQLSLSHVFALIVPMSVAFGVLILIYHLLCRRRHIYKSEEVTPIAAPRSLEVGKRRDASYILVDNDGTIAALNVEP